MPVATFGRRALVKVQRHLLTGTATTDGTTRRQLSCRHVSDVIGRVRTLFDWGVPHELVPDDRVKALEIVPALARGQSDARERPRRKAVRPSVVEATLPHLTAEVADVIRLIHLTGCRPSEACRMTLHRIRDRNKAVWRHVPKTPEPRSAPPPHGFHRAFS